MANYTNERARYGGCTGQILVHSTPGLGQNNDPNSAAFKRDLPAGYLRCDGSILNASDYLALSRILGVGSSSRFRKEGANIREENLETGDRGQFQLPDLGSKVVIGGRGTGLYQNDFIDTGVEGATTVVNRVGPQIEVVSNFGNQIESFYQGNMQLSASGPIDMLGSPKYNLPKDTSETQLNIENFQGHLHNANQTFVNYSANHATAAQGGKDYQRSLANSGSGNVLSSSNIGGGESIHKHNITPPISYTHTFTYSHPQQQVSMAGVSVTVDVDVSDDEKLDALVTPFILVEYIIKF